MSFNVDRADRLNAIADSMISRLERMALDEDSDAEQMGDLAYAIRNIVDAAEMVRQSAERPPANYEQYPPSPYYSK